MKKTELKAKAKAFIKMQDLVNAKEKGEGVIKAQYLYDLLADFAISLNDPPEKEVDVKKTELRQLAKAKEFLKMANIGGLCFALEGGTMELDSVLCDFVEYVDKDKAEFPLTPKEASDSYSPNRRRNYSLTIDFAMLRQQKAELLAILNDDNNKDAVANYSSLDGLLGIIDGLQDQAVDIHGVPEKEVFHLDSSIFEVTLPGFDGSTDKTDHLVKWVKAFNIDDVKQHYDKQGVKGYNVCSVPLVDHDLAERNTCLDLDLTEDAVNDEPSDIFRDVSDPKEENLGSPLKAITYTQGEIDKMQKRIALQTFGAYQHFLYYFVQSHFETNSPFGAHMTSHFLNKLSGLRNRNKSEDYNSVAVLVFWVQEMSSHYQADLLDYIMKYHSNKW